MTEMDDATVYWQALETLLSRCATMKDGPLSVLLYGSMVRGQVRAGKSDIMDAVLVFSKDLHQDFAGYVERLEIIISILKELRDFNLPFHPFHSCSLSELRGMWPGYFSEVWTKEELSRPVSGPDLRNEIVFTEQDLRYAKMLFFASRIRLQMKLTSLDRREIPGDLNRLVHAVRHLLKCVPQLACYVCNHPVDSSGALIVLADLAGQKLLDDYQDLQAFVEADLETQRAHMKEALALARELTEHLHDAVMSWLTARDLRADLERTMMDEPV